MIFGECEECGAVTRAEDEDGVSWGDPARHAEWHKKMQDYVNVLYQVACNETQLRLGDYLDKVRRRN